MKVSILLCRSALASSVVLWMASCASKHTVRFITPTPGTTISVVSQTALESAGSTLPNSAPVSLEDIAGKAVKISAFGKTTQYWMALGDTGRNYDVRVHGLLSCQPLGERNRNIPMRLLMKAYQAFAGKNYVMAAELAGKAAEADPTLAAPHIIDGLAAFRGNNKSRARASFTKAKSLDPEDSEISQLLSLIE